MNMRTSPPNVIYDRQYRVEPPACNAVPEVGKSLTTEILEQLSFLNKDLIVLRDRTERMCFRLLGDPNTITSSDSTKKLAECPPQPALSEILCQITDIRNTTETISGYVGRLESI
jgi:hypothetical protein